MIRFMRSERLLKIAEIFNIKGYSTVSGAIQRVRDLRKKDKKIRKEIDSINKKNIQKLNEDLIPFLTN